LNEKNHSQTDFENLDNPKNRLIVSAYALSTGSKVQIFDCNFQSLEIGDTLEQEVCCYCNGSAARGDASGSGGESGNASCRDLHINAMREASSQGKSNIYQCALGLEFWTCPVYHEGRFFGALRGSGYVTDKALLATQCRAACNGAIPEEEFAQRVCAFPQGDADKIKSLAELLLLCAESFSGGGENYHRLLRLRSDQQAAISVLIEELKQKYPEGTPLPGYPLEKEHLLIVAIRKGNREEAVQYLNELLAALVFCNKNQFKHIQLRSLELAVLLARAGYDPGGSGFSDTNASYLRHIQEAKTVEDLTSTLHNIVESIIAHIASFQGIPHASAMRKAEQFIRENLTRKMSLGEIAGIAGLSAPYFSTIFKNEMGENLSKYINRLRVEKASKMLLETNLSLSDISSECCFEDQSWFSKIFKSFTGISPGKYRSQGGNVIGNG
jgi:AraC-like DNA-binding protein